MEGGSGGWRPDPTGRHQHRYHDGTAWTANVADDGRVGEDALDPPAPQPVAGAAPPAEGAADEGRRYDAFISYSHADDPKIAEAIQQGLVHLARPWRSRRAMEVFRDATSLTANPGLWSTLAGTIERSRWLVVLASPHSANAPWVNKEVEHWLATHGADRIILARTGGTIRWEDGGFSADTDAVPAALRHAFTSEPLHVDLSWAARSPDHLTLKDSVFRREIARIAAPIRGVDLEDLESEDIRIQRRVKRLTRGAVAALAVLTAASTVAGAVALEQRSEAEAQRDRATEEARAATSQALAARADAATAERPDRRLLLAVAAERMQPTPASRRALVSAMLDLKDVEVLLPGHRDVVIDLDGTPEGDRLATVDGAGDVRVWDLSDGSLILGPLPLAARVARLTHDGATLVTVDAEGNATWTPVAGGDARTHQVVGGDEVIASGCGAWGCHPWADLSPDGQLAVGVDLERDGAAAAVRFVSSDGVATDVATDGPVTGLIWSDQGRLIVGDWEGLAVWSGSDGPVRDGYDRTFDVLAGFMPGGVAIGPASELEPDREVLVYIGPDYGGGDEAPTMLNIVPVDDNGMDLGDVAVISPTAGYSNPLQQQGFRDHLSAVAVSDGQAVVGTDGQSGAALAPSLTLVQPGTADQTHLADADLPPRAVTRIAAAGFGRYAVAGFDGTVRVFGPDHPLLSLVQADTDLTLDDALADLDDPSGGSAVDLSVPTMPELPGRQARADAVEQAVAASDVDGLEVIDATVLPDDTVLAVVARPGDPYDLTGASRPLNGELRAFDDGEDVTPERWQGLSASSVAYHPDGEVLVGAAGGLIEVLDWEAGTIVQSSRVSRSPIGSLEVSPDGRWILARSAETLALLTAPDLALASVLAGTSNIADASYRVPSVSQSLVAGFAQDGRVVVGWVGEPVRPEPDEHSGPFGGETVAESGPRPLPGSVEDLTMSTPVGVHVEIDLEDLVERGCALANRDLDRDEWARAAGDLPFTPVCPDRASADGDESRPLLEPLVGVERLVDLSGGSSDGGDGTDSPPLGPEVETEGVADPTEALEAWLADEEPDAAYLGPCLDDPTSAPVADGFCDLPLSGLHVLVSADHYWVVELDDGLNPRCEVDGADCVGAPSYSVGRAWRSDDGSPPDWTANVTSLIDSYVGGP